MASNTECCGWASRGELAGMGDALRAVEGWEKAEHPAMPSTRVHAGEVGRVRWRSGQRARVHLAMLRRRLRERNKRVVANPGSPPPIEVEGELSGE